ncbi:hypothetical protein QE152_g27360 [Popillia japonica]|uniref:Integrase catalytic domain-containing protein n=1 Tax=Popillia japonica TaxID=7064 RepID=A0AAW1JT80_POPJA
MAENITGIKIKTIRTDNGLEFVNEGITKICEEKGICHQRTCVYTPEQNGRAERENRTIVESIRTLLHSSDLDKAFWAEAANRVVFTINRARSSPQKDKTPFQVWYKKDCNMQIFREFGRRVSVHVPKKKRLKLGAKNEIGIFVGYSEEIKGYRVFFPHKTKVEIHRDVIFIHENQRIEENQIENRQSEKTIILNLENETNEKEENIEGSDHEEEIMNVNEPQQEIEISEEENVMSRPGKRGIKKPAGMKHFDVSADSASMCVYSVNEEPMTYEEAVSGANSTQWRDAMEKELSVLRENDTWCEVPWPVNEKVIDKSANIAKVGDAPNILVESISTINTYADTYENDVDESEIVTGQMFGTLDLLNNNEKIDQEDSVDVEERVVEQHIQELEWYGLENLAGIIEFRLQKKENLGYIPDTSDMSNSWVNHLSEGGLLKPNEDFLTKLNNVANNFLPKLCANKQIQEILNNS